MRTVHTRLLCGVFALLASVTLGAEEFPDSVRGAIVEQQALIAEQPDNAEAYNDLGNLLLLGHEPEMAELAYRQATTLDDRSISGHFNLGLLLAQRGELEGARQEFDRVLSLDAGHAWGHFQVGRLDEIAGKTERAISSYAEAFRLDPTLSFSDLNPQVLDSQLTTRALLAIDSGGESASEAPRAYEDPFRIASLLLPKLPEEESEEDPAPQVDMETESVEGEPTEVPATGRTLSQRDLDSDSDIGEADPPAVATTNRGRGRSSGRASSRLPRPSTTSRSTPNNGQDTTSGHVGRRSDRSGSQSNQRSSGQIRTRTLPN